MNGRASVRISEHRQCSVNVRRNDAFRSEHAKNGGARTSPAPKRPRSECENSALKTNEL
jgi:hypothetical protein